MRVVKSYLFRVFLSISMLLNVALGGELGQTFSARQHELRRKGKPHMAPVVDLFCGENHCSDSWVYWKVRKW